MHAAAVATLGLSTRVRGYDLADELCRNEWHVLHRGRRREDGRAVLVKVPCSAPPRILEIDLLKREHAILGQFDLPGVPRPQALVDSAGSCALVLDDPGGIPLRNRERCRPLPAGEFLDLAIRLATILAELQRRDIIHQNISPRSILRDGETGQVWLGDFGLSVLASGGGPAPPSAHLFRSVLPYLAPEQTARMNRTRDYRSDLYSLGVTLYEVLTGVPPFESDDPLELIHWHIAKPPTAPTLVNPEVPEIISKIVMKLLAKTPEERYQTARGLCADLETCARELASTGQVTVFHLGRRDVSDRFLLPQKLYGRTGEVTALAQAFERVCDGPAAMMVVAGYAGIGKTSLIQELYKPIARQRGYFIAGKFDQIVRNIPYGALIQAFRGLIQQLLAESEERLADWRARLSGALGSSGAVLAEVIPEIERIVGAQGRPASLGPTEAQNRFRRVFQRFVGAIAQREHPLVVFLDDLQWADSATLSLLTPLLTSPDVRSLFVIGAYRDNEVDTSHPLMGTLQHVESAGARLDRILLGPLDLPDLTLLIGDTLQSDAPDVEPLAALVLQKTGGNPFFVLQFLKTLRQDGLLVFDDRLGHWTVRMEVRTASMTDNVIDLMTRKIRELPRDTQQVLTLAACIGNPFDPASLAVVSRQSFEAVATNLHEALAAGLIQTVEAPYDTRPSGSADAEMTAGPAYAFLHDRVQQAAYGLIPAEKLPSVHLTSGRLLLERSTASGEDRLFDIVHHLNLGKVLITDEEERRLLARLNLDAGRKAKSATAYQLALGYFQTGIDCLSEKSWESAYTLAFSLRLEAAECKYLCGEFDEAERKCDRLLARAQTPLEKAQVCALKILQYEHTSRYADAIRTGREGIRLFGITFPDGPEERRAALDDELARIQTLLNGRPIESLIDLPLMTDPDAGALMRLLANLHTSCFLSGDKPLTLLNTATMVRLSLQHGNLAESAYAYALHAAMLEGPIRKDFRAAYDFGMLALRLSERLNDPALRAKVLMMFAWAISLWRMPLEASFPPTREAFRLGNETGLFVDAAWALFNELWFALLTAGSLAVFSETHTSHVDYSVRIKMPHIADAKRVILQWGRAMQGRTVHPCSLSDATFDEADYCRTYAGQRLFEMFLCVAKLALLYTFDDYEAAQRTAQRAETIIHDDFKGTIWDALRVFYHALTLTALHPSTPGDAGAEAALKLEALNGRLKWWAENSPRNFEPWHLIVSAEIARTNGKATEAASLYEAAIDAAKPTERLRERALAMELYAKFWRDRGQDRAATAFMGEARDVYARWGATAKVASVTEKYPDILGQPIERSSVLAEPVAPSLHDSTPAEVAVNAPDVATVMKCAQAIAGEIELDRLLATLLRIAVENAGAERGNLLLERAGSSFVHAEGSLDAVQVRLRDPVPLGEAADLPASIVHYVRRTLEAVVLPDARSDDRYANDPCIRRRQPRSVLCAPVLGQGRLIGILYLENNLVSGAFTPDRIELMQILASQAAISLENATLYDGMKEEVAARRRAEEDLRVALSQVESLKNRLLNENVYLQEEIRREHNFAEMVGNSPALLAVLRKVEQVARTDSTVLIFGETGTGKELIAHAIHNRSTRKDRPLVKVNCSAISAGLVESELFGHVKGAFTGALERRIGRFELADGGTLFLDEIGELPPETQVKLLRVLQEGEFEPVGSSSTVRVNVRLIAATNRDLREAIQTGRFRSDLFYRLNVLPLEVPPLRERQSDIPQLVMFFLSHFATKFGKKLDTVSHETLDRLVSYSWPGNIRELRNVIERAVVLSQSPILMLGQDLLPMEASGPNRQAANGSTEALPAAVATEDRPPRADNANPPTLATLRDAERHHILAALRKSRWVVEGPHGAARILNLHPNTLRSRMKRLGITRAGHEIS